MAENMRMMVIVICHFFGAWTWFITLCIDIANSFLFTRSSLNKVIHQNIVVASDRQYSCTFSHM